MSHEQSSAWKLVTTFSISIFFSDMVWRIADSKLYKSNENIKLLQTAAEMYALELLSDHGQRGQSCAA